MRAQEEPTGSDESREVEWRDLVGLEYDEETNTLYITEPSEEWGSIGAASVDVLTEEYDGGVFFYASYESGARAIGLSYNNEDADFTSINYSIYLQDETIFLFENGEMIGDFGSFEEGTELAIVKMDGVILYMSNGEVMHESAYEGGDLLVDIAVQGENVVLEDIRIDFPIGEESEGGEEEYPDEEPQEPEEPFQPAFTFPAVGVHICNTNPNLNWEMNRSYDLAGNVIGASINYTNAQGQLMQAQNHNLSRGEVFAVQPLRDKYGRNVIRSNVAPLNTSTSCYNPNFFVDVNGNPYSYSNFDDAKLNNPDPVGNSLAGTLGHYYSNNNTKDPYQATTQYPYSRAYFHPRLNQQTRVASAGNSKRMGSGNEAQMYSIPAKGELYYLFGYAHGWTVNANGNSMTNVGYQVNKTITIDADGKEAVLFIDRDGKKVASCLSGSVNGSNKRTMAVKALMENQLYVDIHLPKGCENSLRFPEYMNASQGIKFQYEIIDLKTNTNVQFGSGNTIFEGTTPNLPAGLYRIKEVSWQNQLNYWIYGTVISPEISYNLNYYEFTLNYYDKAGRLVKVIPPLGISTTYNPTTSQINGNTSNYPIYNYSGNFSFSTSSNDKDISFTASTPSATDEYREIFIKLKLKDPTVPIGTYGDEATLEPGFEMESEGGQGAGEEPGEAPEEPGGAEGGEPGGQSTTNPVYYYDDLVIEGTGQGGLGSGLTVPYEGGTGLPPDPPGGLELACAKLADIYSIEFDIYTASAYSAGQAPDIASGKKVFIKKKYDPEDCELKEVVLTNASVIIPHSLSAQLDNVVLKVVQVEHLVADYFFETIKPLDADALNVLDDYKLELSELKNSSGEPAHTMATTYEYNSLNQMIARQSPDEGRTEYVYRKDGQIRFSENAKQRADGWQGSFSYTNFDALGRPVEIGTFKSGGNSADRYFQNMTEAPINSRSTHHIINNIYNPSSSVADGLDDSYCKDQNFIKYDLADPDFATTTGLSVANYKQSFLRGNISKTSNDYVTTWYSYDDLGRVRWAVRKLDGAGVKTINYSYGPNGQVKESVYQKEVPSERFYHRFQYDIQGRLLKVLTSTDRVNWLEQAQYTYDPLGRVKRVELADDLQGVDYVYTLDGKLKSINHPSMELEKDPGEDRVATSSHKRFAPDVFSMSLDYYNQDYLREGTYINYGNNTGNHHNGLVKSWRWNLRTNSTQTFNRQETYNYTYDQHGWLTQAVYGNYTAATCQNKPGNMNCINALQDGVPLGANEILNVNPAFSAAANSAYKVWGITYDANGNLLTLNRNGYGASSEVSMDGFTYHYPLSNGQRINNRLSYVTDSRDNSNTTRYQDLRNQSLNNYTYNQRGQLTDVYDENTHIEYNSLGLVESIWGNYGSTYAFKRVEYFYDDRGNRYLKVDYDDNPDYNVEVKRTYYVRDAAGTLMAVYEKTPFQNMSSVKPEHPVYGHGRVGIFDRINATGGGYNGYLYELTDVIGNVRAVVEKGSEIYYLPRMLDEDNFDDRTYQGWGGVYDEYENQATLTSVSSRYLGCQGEHLESDVALSKLFSVSANDQTNCNTFELCFDLLAFSNSYMKVIVHYAGGSVQQNITSQGTHCIGLPGGKSSYNVFLIGYGGQAHLSIDNVKLKAKCGENLPAAVVLNATDYYPFGMAMPNKQFTTGAGAYRFAFQGQERDREPGTEHEFFQLRTWDGRLGRWSTTDPYGQYHSSYLGMGNSPVNGIDPDGGNFWEGLWAFAKGWGWHDQISTEGWGPYDYFGGFRWGTIWGNSDAFWRSMAGNAPTANLATASNEKILGTLLANNRIDVAAGRYTNLFQVFDGFSDDGTYTFSGEVRLRDDPNSEGYNISGSMAATDVARLGRYDDAAGRVIVSTVSASSPQQTISTESGLTTVTITQTVTINLNVGFSNVQLTANNMRSVTYNEFGKVVDRGFSNAGGNMVLRMGFLTKTSLVAKYHSLETYQSFLNAVDNL
ncbi:MAG: hypothetical protein CMI36_01520 [Owenweeksia sp.]|nr:hypothetical protein [Owenweeksia sp.]